VSTEEITILTINMRFRPVGSNMRSRLINIQRRMELLEKQAEHMEQIDMSSRDLADKVMPGFTRERS